MRRYRGDSNLHIQNIRFYGEVLKIIHFYHFDSDPRFPPFYYMLGVNLGSLLYGDVSVMCSSSPYSLLLRSLLEYSLDWESHRDRLFCRPCKRLRVFVGSHIFHKCQQTSKGLSHFPRRYRETLSNVFGKCLYLHE